MSEIFIKEPKINSFDYDPSSYFNDWAFHIPEYYWSLFGIRRAAWLDKEKNEPLRQRRTKELIDLGLEKKEARSVAVKEIQHKRYGWGIFPINDNEFSEFYSFFHKNSIEQIQIIKNELQLIVFLFFNIQTKRYTKLKAVEFYKFIQFLQTGEEALLTEYPPVQLPESDIKYEIIKHLSDG